MVNQKSLSINEEVKKLYDDYKSYLMPESSANDFIKRLVVSSPEYNNFIESVENEKLIKKFMKMSKINPKLSWGDFMLIEEELNEK